MRDWEGGWVRAECGGDNCAATANLPVIRAGHVRHGNRARSRNKRARNGYLGTTERSTGTNSAERDGTRCGRWGMETGAAGPASLHKRSTPRGVVQLTRAVLKSPKMDIAAAGTLWCRLAEDRSRLEGRERELTEELTRMRQGLHGTRMDLVRCGPPLRDHLCGELRCRAGALPNPPSLPASHVNTSKYDSGHQRRRCDPPAFPLRRRYLSAFASKGDDADSAAQGGASTAKAHAAGPRALLLHTAPTPLSHNPHRVLMWAAFTPAPGSLAWVLPLFTPWPSTRSWCVRRRPALRCTSGMTR
jgi:hypothetical protein